MRLGRPDEAAHSGVIAIKSNQLVSSNAWRADELGAAEQSAGTAAYPRSRRYASWPRSEPD
jgi:hypothetical protein